MPIDDVEIKKFRDKEEEVFIEFLSKKIGVPTISFSDISVEPDALTLIDEERAKKAKVAIFKMERDGVVLAVRDPENKEYLKILEEFKTKKKVRVYLATEKTLNRIWDYYNDIKLSTKVARGVIGISAEKIERYLSLSKSEVQFLEFLKEESIKDVSGKISDTLELLISGSIVLKASDIHLEPTGAGGVVRFRIDGVLTEVLDLNEKKFNAIVVRIKLTAGMKLNVVAQAQDGRFSIRLNKKDIEVRVSAVPDIDGESIVMRLLDPDSLSIGIEYLGLHKSLLGIFKTESHKPNGMIIVTGPTGSGKTTTLYSFLKEIYKPRKIKIITLENPVEYKLEGIIQTQITKNYSFTQGLRASLRQDPDVILVGEIRDEEVARIATNAALTGHLVLSTLHTNDALGTLSRLLDLGIDPTALASSMNLIVAQRLLRKINPKYEKERKLTEIEKEKIKKIITNMPPKIRKEAESYGLEKIKEPDLEKARENLVSGYEGRTGVFEVIVVDKKIQVAIETEKSITAIRGVIEEQGLMTMQEDAVLKILSGVTSIEEARRVLGYFI